MVAFNPMVRPNNPPRPEYDALPCLIQSREDEPDNPVSVQEFSPEELVRYAVCLGAIHEVFQTQGPVMDDTMLPGYVFFFEEMKRADGLTGMVFPEGETVEAESMVLSFTIVLKENYDHRELTEFAELHPEYGFRKPPKPPYCIITPQDLYDEHRDHMKEILHMVCGYALVWKSV